MMNTAPLTLNQIAEMSDEEIADYNEREMQKLAEQLGFIR